MVAYNNDIITGKGSYLGPLATTHGYRLLN